MNASHRLNDLLRRTFVVTWLSALIAIPAGAESGSTVVLDETFDQAPGVAWSHPSIDSAPSGESFLGRFGADTVTLKLDGLPEHGWVRISFDVYVIGTWDGDTRKFGPDLFSVSTGDGRPLVRTCFGHNEIQAYPGRHGVHQAGPQAGASAINTLGYAVNGVKADSVYRIELEFPHSGDSLSLDFKSAIYGPFNTESWGLDNVTVTTRSAPSQTVDEEQLESVWENLGSEDGAIAEKALWELVAAAERGVVFVAPRLTTPVPKLVGTADTSELWVADDQEALAAITHEFQPEHRRVILAEQALSIIGSPAAEDAVKTIQYHENDLPEPSSTLVLTVREAQTLEPIAGQTVRVSTTCATHDSVVTDSSGQARVHVLGETPAYLSLRAAAPGRVPMSYTFRDLGPQEPLPSALTLDLSEGTTIGGRIVNEADEPIGGADVHLLVPNNRSNDGPRIAVSGHVVTTDADGRWVCDIMPAELDDVWVRLAHPDYVDDPMYGSTPKPTIEQLRDRTGVMVMKRGLTLTGVVLDAHGRPVVGATVAQGSDRFGTHNPEATTDAEGRFVFIATEPGEIVLTVQSEAHAPAIEQVYLHDDSEPLAITLSKGHTLRGRVVDQDGQPIDDVWVTSDTWRGFRTLNYSTRTGPDGTFEFTNAPEDAVQFDILKQGYADVRNHHLRAGDGSVTITMRPPLTAVGTVVDAETGEPLPEFRVVAGIGFDNSPKPHWQRQESSHYQDGSFEVSYGYPYPSRYLRVEAEGYAPAVSRAFTMDEGTVELTFEMSRSEGLKGTLVNTAGEPVADATVYLAIGRSMPYIRNGRIQQGLECATAETDEHGGFAFPPQDDDYLLLVLNDQGYAELDAQAFADSEGVLTLSPWATVKGLLLVGDEARAGEQVSVWLNRAYAPDNPRPHHDLKTTTDGQGAFTIERVPAGEGGVGRYIQLSESSWSTTVSEKFDAKPGQIIEVSLGGGGRPVVGQFVWPAGVEAKSFAYGHHSMGTKRDPKNNDELRDKYFPKDVMTWDMEKRQAWAESEEGKQAIKDYTEAVSKQQDETRNYNFAIDADGKFRVENVEPGSYQITLQVQEPPVGNQCGFGDQIATLSVDVVVPPLPEGLDYLDEPLDTGTHEVTMLQPAPKVGELAPDISAPLIDLAWGDPDASLDGAEPFSLSDLRGKYVLLDFWATWCGPCIGETPNLQATWDEFGQDGRFVLVGLSLDQSPKAPANYVNKNQITWPQVFLGEWGKHPALNDYAVRGIPSIWLIGPDGKIIAKGLRGDAIKTAVANAMANTPQ